MKDLLAFLIHIIGLRDPHAESHSKHVDNYATALARKAGLSQAEVEQISFAAAVHDIGKMALNDFIVNKPGQFTQAEYMHVQQHSSLGAGILEKLDLDPMIARVVLQHHENFDGTGYPHKLQGDQISMGARIIRITDTYDALTTHRPYRPARTSRKSLAVMEAEAKKFDPQLLEIFFKTRPGQKQ